jgi:hypothetical protein
MLLLPYDLPVLEKFETLPFVDVHIVRMKVIEVIVDLREMEHVQFIVKAYGILHIVFPRDLKLLHKINVISICADVQDRRI